MKATCIELEPRKHAVVRLDPSWIARVLFNAKPVVVRLECSSVFRSCWIHTGSGRDAADAPYGRIIINAIDMHDLVMIPRAIAAPRPSSPPEPPIPRQGPTGYLWDARRRVWVNHNSKHEISGEEWLATVMDRSAP